jgi:hypothetical protein
VIRAVAAGNGNGPASHLIFEEKGYTLYKNEYHERRAHGGFLSSHFGICVSRGERLLL